MIVRFCVCRAVFYDYYRVLCAGFHRNRSVVELRAQCQNLKTLPSFTVVFIVFSLYMGHVQLFPVTTLAYAVNVSRKK